MNGVRVGGPADDAKLSLLGTALIVSFEGTRFAMCAPSPNRWIGTTTQGSGEALSH